MKNTAKMILLRILPPMPNARKGSLALLAILLAGSSLLPVSASVWSNAAVEAVPETIEALTAASSRAAWDASLRCRY